MKLPRILLVLLTAVCLMAAPQADTKNKKKIDTTKQAAPAGALMDINTASAAQLQTLTGIGDAYSKKIIARQPKK